MTAQLPALSSSLGGRTQQRKVHRSSIDCPSTCHKGTAQADGTDPTEQRPNTGVTDSQRISLRLNAVIQQSHHLLKWSFSAPTTTPSQDSESGKTEEPRRTLVINNRA